MTRVLLSAILAFMAIGCSDSSSTKVKVEASNAYVIFDSDAGNIPYPNNILFAASSEATLDGTLNIPYEDTDADATVKFALNTLDGFSTTSPITIGFGGEVNASTLITGLKVYEIAATASAKTGNVPIIDGITADLTYGRDYVTAVSGEKIVVMPIKALKSNQNYMIVLTSAITDTDGLSLTADIASDLLLSEDALVDAQGNSVSDLPTDKAVVLEGIRQATQAMISYTIAQKGIAREDIVSAWSFKTQSIGTHFADVATANKAGALQVGNSGMTTADVGIYGKADIWVGAMGNLPYYLGTPSATNPTAALSGFYVNDAGSPIFTGMPKQQSTKTVPVLMTKPNATSTAVIAGAVAPWPVVIFQHGITRNRTDVLAIADALADAGYATIAMDLPLHGLDSNESQLMTSYERTFDMDLVEQDSDGGVVSEGPDGVIDTSGRHYINFTSLLTTRDNMRQSASDLLALKNALGAAGVGIGDIDSTRVAFVGHSLGTIAAFGFLSQTKVESVTLAMPGGGIAEFLNNSPSFANEIEEGLAAKGIDKGTSSYASFILATQTVIDDADPINYTTAVATTQAGKIFAIEVVGNGTEGTSDQVIPNSVTTAPLSGTEPLVQYLGTTNLESDTTPVAPGKTARFTVGDHGSILDPSASLPATTAMQTQMANFVGSRGTYLPVVDASVLQIAE